MASRTSTADGGPSTRVQSLQFDKRLFAPAEARRWAAQNGLRAPATDELVHVLRIVQEPVGNFRPGSLRSVALDTGVVAWIGEPKRGIAPRPPPTFREEVASVKREAMEAVVGIRKGLGGVAKTVKKAVRPAGGRKCRASKRR